MKTKDKVIVITGASEGIGKALAQALAPHGAKLVLVARSADKLKALAATLPGSSVIAADLRQDKEIKKMIETAVKTHGRIDILVNNAGQGMYGAVESIKIDDYQGMIDLNIMAPLKAMQLAIPHMKAQGGGMIINISSMVSKNAYPYLGAYASTKYALNALSLTARAELAQDNIVVSLMHPKMTATRFGENALGQRPDFSSRPAASAPAVDSAEDVAKKILELIDSEAPEENM